MGAVELREAPGRIHGRKGGQRSVEAITKVEDDLDRRAPSVKE